MALSTLCTPHTLNVFDKVLWHRKVLSGQVLRLGLYWCKAMLITSGINLYQPMNNCLNTDVLYSLFCGKGLSDVYSTQQSDF